MDFKLTEEQQMIQDMAREFADEVIAPKAADMDAREELDLDILRQAAELGFMGITIPEEYGGTGLGEVELILVLEQINRACASTGVTISVQNSLYTSPMLNFANEAQKRKYLPGIASGEIIGAYALTESNAGTDAANQQTTAVRDGDDYLLNGTKIFITNGGFADSVIVFTRTSSEGRPHQGISAFIVDKEFEGFAVGAVEHKLGIRASSTTEIVLDNCRVPAENLLGEENKGFKIAMETLNHGRLGICAQGLGIAQASLDFAVNYAGERVAFGKPLMAIQAIQFKLANIAMEIEAGRLLTYRAALHSDEGTMQPHEAAMAKLFTSRLATKASFEAIQVAGGYGYSREYPAERFYRDARITEIYEGTSEVKQIVIARSL